MYLFPTCLSDGIIFNTQSQIDHFQINLTLNVYYLPLSLYLQPKEHILVESGSHGQFFIDTPANKNKRKSMLNIIQLKWLYCSRKND